VDKRVRLNDKCVIGLPSCDFAFSSTRCAFIGYPFEEAALEVGIIKRLLEERGIQPVEAGGTRTPGQSAFCAKICSKIITSQFCIVILNNKLIDSLEIPNPNVNMEYGLMLGFNKYVIPFQLSNQTLAFNVAGLDTVKYTNTDFEVLASRAIDQAIKETAQTAVAEQFPADQVMHAFLVEHGRLVTPLTNDGERDLYNLGAHLGFHLLNDFAGMKYAFLGNFTFLRPETILWRMRKLDEIVGGRTSSFEAKLKAGLGTKEQIKLLSEVMAGLEVWVVVNTDSDRQSLLKELAISGTKISGRIFTLDEVNKVQERFGTSQ
jgi:hypothetical protein